MKKTISILLVMIMCFSTLVITGCSNAKNSTNDTSNTDDANESKTTIESALAFYTEVWAAFGEDNKFSCAGGDMDHIAEGPGQFV